MGSYERARCERAFADTKQFWRVHQTWKHFVPALTGFVAGVARMIRYGHKELLDTALQGLVWAICFYVVSWVGSFFINYIWITPAALHREQRKQIDQLQDQTSDATGKLEQAKVGASATPHEQAQRRLVSEKMAGFTSEETKVIRALLQHGEVHARDVSSLGFTMDSFYMAIDKGKRTGLVKQREDRHSGGVEKHLSINPTFELALQHYFTQQ